MTDFGFFLVFCAMLILYVLGQFLFSNGPLHLPYLLFFPNKINFEFHLFHLLLWGGIIMVALYCFYSVVHANMVTADATQRIERTRPTAHETNRLSPNPHKRPAHKQVAKRQTSKRPSPASSRHPAP